MTASIQSTIKQLESLLENTTPGPWTLCAHLRHDHENGCKCGYRGVIYGGNTDHAICQPGHDTTPGEEGLDPPRYPRNIEVANARLIALAPSLAAELIEARKEIVKLRSALGDIPDLMPQWQPIETAPKDGTWFWASYDGDAISVRWHDTFEAFVSSWREMTFAESYGGGTKLHSPTTHAPAYWMARIAPPAKKGGDV